MEKLYEYKNLGVLKNYIGSFSSNIIFTIISISERKKVGMIFFPILIVWKPILLFMLSSEGKPACMPKLLYGAEVFTLTPTLLLRVERCKSIFYVPMFALGHLLLALSCLNSIESEIAIRKLLLLGRLIKEPKMPPAMKSLLTAEQKASLTQILHHWVFCLALQRHYINMSYFITSKIGIIALHSRFTLLGKNCAK